MLLSLEKERKKELLYAVQAGRNKVRERRQKSERKEQCSEERGERTKLESASKSKRGTVSEVRRGLLLLSTRLHKRGDEHNAGVEKVWSLWWRDKKEEEDKERKSHDQNEDDLFVWSVVGGSCRQYRVTLIHNRSGNMRHGDWPLRLRAKGCLHC